MFQKYCVVFQELFVVFADMGHRKTGMAMNILFKPRVEATEQMTLNKDNRTFRNPRINESAKLRLSDMYVVVVSCFHSILHLKT